MLATTYSSNYSKSKEGKLTEATLSLSMLTFESGPRSTPALAARPLLAQPRVARSAFPDVSKFRTWTRAEARRLEFEF